MPPLLELNDVSYAYHSQQGEVPALEHLTFQVAEGEFLAIVGPSGCGKSTLLSLICGLYAPESGEILYRGSNVMRVVSDIGYMLQKDQLFEWRSIYKNVILGLEIQKKRNAQSLAYVNQMLKEYELWAFRSHRPSQLSGGMRQRAALIRTLALNPSLLLLDEPFSALDYQTRLSVCDDIFHIIKKEKKTAILVTHDLAEAISVADRILVLSARPGHIQSIFKLHLTVDENTPMNCRNAPEFKDYFNQIWEELNRHA